MMIDSIFSFSHIIFLAIRDKFQHFSNTFNFYMSEILLFCIQTLFMNSFLDNQFYINYKVLCVSQFRLAICFFNKFFQAVFVFTFYFCVILHFLYSRMDRSGAYCFTVVRLSAENLTCELNIFL